MALLGRERWLATLLCVAALLAIGVIAGLVQNTRRCAEIAAALSDSTRGRLRPTSASTARHLEARIEPAPDPFREFTVSFAAVTTFSPLDLALRLFFGRKQRLLIRGELLKRPEEEIVWLRGHAPARSLGRSAATALWVQRRLDIVNGEYAVHGVNPAAIEHAFWDLQTRFGAVLEKISVQADATPGVEIIVRADNLNAEDLPALVTTIRSLGRASSR